MAEKLKTKDGKTVPCNKVYTKAFYANGKGVTHTTVNRMIKRDELIEIPINGGTLVCEPSSVQ